MSAGTMIEWTDETANVFYAVDSKTGRRGWHCEVVSEGCQNCYAATKNKGFYAMGTKRPYRQDQRPSLSWRIDREQMAKWARRRVPRRIFVNSMSDHFGEWWPSDWIYDSLDAMAAAPRLTFQASRSGRSAWSISSGPGWRPAVCQWSRVIST